VLGHPAEGQQRVRSRHGGRAGRLHAAARSRLPAGLPGREFKATPRGDARADPDETGTSGPLRLRVRAKRNRQPLHDVCAARRLASCQSGAKLFRAVAGPLDKVSTGYAAVSGGDDSKRITINTVPSFAALWLVPRLGSVTAAHPDVTISIETDRRTSRSR
jgi:LysR family glycine cleavage system transcriptional activator